MSGFKGITTNTSPETAPHIYAEDDAAIYRSIFGPDGVSTIGQQCAATVISNNKVRIADGVICVGGHFGRIPYGEYVDCEIENGATGVKRNDIIVARFETTGTGGIDTFTCAVVKGTAGTTATDPTITKNDLYSGGALYELPLYRVKIEGLSITAVDKLFTVIQTNAELQKKVSQLNSELNVIGTSYWSGGGNSFSHNGGSKWQNTSYGVTIPAGTYIITLTASVCTVNDTLYDFVTLGMTGCNAYESSCSFNLTANNNNFYPRCTHTFFTTLGAGTYYFTAWSTYARNFQEVEIAALRIK